MSISLNTGTREIPLKFAREITKIVNNAWDSGEFLAKVTPVTQDLLRFWFFDSFVETRLVETKARKDVKDENVLLKKQSALDWLKKINELKPDDRDNCEWSYALLGENTFYSMNAKGASIPEILEYSKLAKHRLEGTLF